MLNRMEFVAHLLDIFHQDDILYVALYIGEFPSLDYLLEMKTKLGIRPTAVVNQNIRNMILIILSMFFLLV